MQTHTFFVRLNGGNDETLDQSHPEENDVGKKKSIVNSKEVLISPETIKVQNQHENVATN